MKNILACSHVEARQFFLKEESYYNFDLPKYFVFKSVLDKVSNEIQDKPLSNFYINDKEKRPYNFENVNYTLLNSKDGKFAWRPFQLIHPALYISLVHSMTYEENWNTIIKKFEEFGNNPKIQCLSIPIESESNQSDKAETVSHWWQAIEQKSIQLALNYEYILHTDISDCYGSIYTHSIAWALHTKNIAKQKKTDKKLIGNIIDEQLRDMSFGQTNGIPQGSILMDFIAEIVLGYADLILSEKTQSINDFQILRYRDDYRIFTNNPQDAELITKHLTEILIDLGMRLNAQKTMISNNVIQSSIKADKLFWIFNKKKVNNLQEQLLLIHELSQKFPNSGSLSKALNTFFNRVKKRNKPNQNIPVLISILIDIALKNPRTYPMVSAILSKFLSLMNPDNNRHEILESIIKRFNKIPNTGYIQIWLQRVILKIERDKSFEETLCKKVNDSSIAIWNSDWLNNSLAKIISSEPIVDEKIIEEINEVIQSEEVELFDSKISYWI